MRLLILTCLSVALLSCGSSGKKGTGANTGENKNTGKEDEITLRPAPITRSDMPAGITCKGVLQDAWQWKDKMGDNIFFTAQVAPYNDNKKGEEGNEGQSAAIYAYLYTRKADGDYERIWKIEIEEESCPVDLTCSFIKGSSIVTDLDNNGIAETKVQYRLACRGDVSPADMKLEMHEGNKSYSLQGSSWIAYSPDLKFNVNEQNASLEHAPAFKDDLEEMEYTMGRYKDEKDFAQAPPVFLSFARREWIKYAKENLGE